MRDIDRLTTRDEYGNADIVGVDSAKLQRPLAFAEFNLVNDALNRLADYEDTGLMPKEVARLEAALERAIDYIVKLSDCCPPGMGCHTNGYPNKFGGVSSCRDCVRDYLTKEGEAE